jgi:outer membrane protein OmpA-like peptidoglycan-associated protein
MRCPSCGHENAIASAPFCGGCGKPLNPQADASASPTLSPASRQDSSTLALLSSADVSPEIHNSRPRWLIRAVVGVCAIVALSGGLALWYRKSLALAHRPVPTTNPPEHRTDAIDPLRASVSATIPAGANIAASDIGGEIESITGTYGPGHNGRFLTDGMPEPVWTPDGDVTFPLEIVFSFYKREPALISAVVLALPNDQSGPKDVEISTSMDSATDGFSKVAAVTVDPNSPLQTIVIPPVQARYLKLNLVSGGQAATLGIGEIQVIEGSTSGYTSLQARYPDMLNWKYSVRHAAQKGIDWLQPASVDWQKQNQCFGCHVQAQTLMGLSVAQDNHYVVSQSCVRDLVEFMRSRQDEDGTEKDQGSGTKATPTQFAAMGLAYFDESTGAKNDETLLKHVDWLSKRLQPSGELVPDMDEPPLAQGSLMTTGNALVAFMQAFAESGDARYQQAADRSLSFMSSAKPRTTQDKVFKVLALSRFGTPQQRQVVASLIRQLQSEQNEDGGWGESPAKHGSSALATGQVLYCFKEAGVSIDSPEFNSGVRYLVKNQTASGSWPPGVTLSSRPSEFAPTMWAVIGLAGALEPPTAESLKAELDKTGHVALYINFDFDKATLRPDAKPIIAQVLKLLKDNPDLNLSIDGHTDNVGLHDYNVKLSQRRAATVVDTLVTAGIASDRLSSGGAGPDSPIADNGTELGRAKNRRVELTKR